MDGNEKPNKLTLEELNQLASQFSNNAKATSLPIVSGPSFSNFPGRPAGIHD